ncbi:MAG: hypothetical protein MJ084_01775 [Saccharofermentans sp.]|nr:hypothetical protein [Saccharofermentans sp.]
MKDKTFYILLALIFVIGTGITIGMFIHGCKLFQTISIVELISNWS